MHRNRDRIPIPKKACSAGSSITAAIITKFLHSQPYFFADDRLLHIGNNLLLVNGVMNILANLIADGGTVYILIEIKVTPSDG